MDKKYPQNEDEICDYLKMARTTNDFYIVQGLISNLFYNKTSKDVDELLLKKSNFYIHAFENIFSNSNFMEALNKVLEQFRYFKKNSGQKYGTSKEFWGTFNDLEIENKKIIFAALITSVSFLSNIFLNLKRNNAIFVAEKLQDSMNKVKNIFGAKFSPTEISQALLSVFDRRFYSKAIFPVRIENFDYLYKQQKISNYLISLTIKLSLKNNLLNSLFKKVESDRLNGKFSTLSIYRISNFIKREINIEQYYVKEIDSLFGTGSLLCDFVERFKNDKNEENALQLIKITLDEFKSKEKKEEDLMRTINKAGIIIQNLESYGAEKFKAFSGEVVGGDFEWSNKILINCSKLLGVLSIMPKVKDKSWRIDVCVREFADWVSSIHKILNKYDIDDDWDKISRYLNQETNRVEWKSTFMTPTQIKKDSAGYQTASKKTFYGIIKTLLGMINSDGGIILIGLVENYQDIVRDDMKEDILEKKGKVFFDVSKELSINDMNLDSIKRKIQDSLKKETLITVDSFNNLWSIEPVIIKAEDGSKEVVIYKIEISKSEKIIPSAKIEGGSEEDISIDYNKSENIWVSVLKRADARTIRVDPRKYLTS